MAKRMRTRKRYSKKRYSKKRYSKKRYSKKRRQSGGTQENAVVLAKEALRKASTDYQQSSELKANAVLAKTSWTEENELDNKTKQIAFQEAKEKLSSAKHVQVHYPQALETAKYLRKNPGVGPHAYMKLNHPRFLLQEDLRVAAEAYDKLNTSLAAKREAGTLTEEDKKELAGLHQEWKAALSARDGGN